jgi:hypothetical protein
MPKRKATVPPTRRRERSSPVGTMELTVKGTNRARSAKKKSALDDHFHRTARGSPARTARDDVGSCNTVKQRFASGATAELGVRSRAGVRGLPVATFGPLQNRT